MTNEIVTSDLGQFGRRELAMAGVLLTALHTINDRTKLLDDGIKVYMNRNSGNVFLCDENYNVAMMNGHNLEDFLSCGDCGHEDFASDMPNSGSECCLQYFGIEERE